MNRVRSDEGLAYSAYSSFPGGAYYPLTFTAGFQSKSRTVAYAASLVIEEVKRMAAGARAGKVKPEDIEGSTFSISNLGMYEVENFIAIINPPEAAILAVGSAREAPVVENGEIRIGWRMKATISVDHRVSDGVEAAKFMQALAVYLEEPLGLLI